MFKRLLCLVIGCNDTGLKGSIDCNTPPVRNIMVFICRRCGVIRIQTFKPRTSEKWDWGGDGL